MTETDRAGNTSSPTRGLRALPQLRGLSLAAATKALVAAGFAVGSVSRQSSSEPAGAVLAPAGVQVLPLGSAVDLAVAAGSAPRAFAAFRLRVTASAIFRPRLHRTIVTTALATRTAIATIELVDGRGHRVASWRKPLRAGVNHPRLLLSAAARTSLIRRPGTYWLRWKAGSPGNTAQDRRRLVVMAG